MGDHPRFFPQGSAWHRERRLLALAPSPEVLPEGDRMIAEKLVSSLRKPGFATEISAALLEIAVTKAQHLNNRPAILEHVGKSLENLWGEERNVITENLRNLEQRMIHGQTNSALDLAREMVTTLRERMGMVGAPSREPGAPERKAGEAKGFFARAWDDAAERWNAIPEERRATITAVGAGALLATAAYGAYRFGRWLFSSAKNVKDATVEGAKKGAHWLWHTLLIGGGLAAAGLAGVAFWSNAREVAQEFARMHREMRDGLAVGMKAANVAAENVRDAVRDIDRRVHDAQSTISAAAMHARTTVASSVAEGEVTLQRLAQKPEAKAALDVGKEGAEILGEGLLSKYLVLFEDHPDIRWPKGTTAENHKDKVDGILSDFSHRKDLTMGEIFACMRFGKIDEAALRRLYPQPPRTDEGGYKAYLAAAELIVRSCLRRRKEVEKMRGGDASPLTFQEYLEHITGSSEAVAAVQQQMETHGVEHIERWDFRDILTALGKGNALQNDLLSILRNHPRFADFLEQRRMAPDAVEKALRNLASLTQALAAAEIPAGGDVAQVQAAVEKVDPGDPALSAERVLGVMLVQELLKSLPTPEQLQPFFNEIFPRGEEWIAPGAGQNISPENTKVIEGYIGEMAFDKAVRIALYKRMMQRENPLGVVLMQAEMLKEIRDKETSWFTIGGVAAIKTQAWRSAENLARRLAEGDYDAELTALYGVSEHMLAKTAQSFQRLAPVLVREGAALAVGTTLSLAEPLLAVAQNNPKSTLVTGTVAGSITGIAAYAKLYDLWHSRTGTALEKLLHNRSVDKFSRDNPLVQKLKLALKSNDYKGAHTWWTAMETGVEQLKSHTLLHGRVERAVVDAMGMKGGATTSAIEGLRDFLRYEEGVTRAAGNIREADLLRELLGKTEEFLTPANAAGRRALQVAAHPLRGRLRTHGIPLIGQALGILGAGFDAVDAFAYKRLAEQARNKKQPELAEVYEELSQLNKGEVVIDLATGLNLYYLPLRGFVALEIARFGAAHGLESIKEDVEATVITDEQARSMPLPELEKKIQEYAPEGGSWGQAWRSGIILSTLSGDTRESLLWESDLIRNNYFRGYLTRRLLEKAGKGDVFAMLIAQPMFDEEGKERPGSAQAINTYIAYVQSELDRRCGTRNDLSMIQKKVGVDRALETADLSASLRMYLDSCLSLLEQNERIQEEAPELLSELEDVEKRYALCGDDEEIAMALKERSALRARNTALTEKANAVVKASLLFEEARVTLPGGTERSLMDIAKEHREAKGGGTPFTAAEVLPLLAPYKGWVRSVEEQYEKELLEKAHESVRQAFGKHAETILKMPPPRILALRQEHAEVLVDMHYFAGSSLKGLQSFQKRGFAADAKEGQALLRARLEALNAYARVAYHEPVLILESFPRQMGGISPPSAFLQAGKYGVSDSAVAFQNNQELLRVYHESGYMIGQSEINSASENSRWYLDKALRRYRKLLDQFR